MPHARTHARTRTHTHTNAGAKLHFKGKALYADSTPVLHDQQHDDWSRGNELSGESPVRETSFEERPVEKTFRNPSELFTGNSRLIWMIRLPNTKFSQHKFQVRLHTYRKGSYPHLRVFFPFSECATHDNSCETASCRNRLQTINVKRHTHKPIPYSGLQHWKTKQDAKRRI